MKAYKAGLPIPEISEAEAERLYEEQKSVGHLQKPSAIAAAEDTGISDADSSSDESEQRSRSPVKAASPRSSKRRKTTKDGVEKGTPPVRSVPVKEIEKHRAPIESPAVERSSKSPEVERKKRSSKRKEDRDIDFTTDPIVDNTPLRSTVQDSTKKEKKRGKKRRSEAIVED